MVDALLNPIKCASQYHGYLWQKSTVTNVYLFALGTTKVSSVNASKATKDTKEQPARPATPSSRRNIHTEPTAPAAAAAQVTRTKAAESRSKRSPSRGTIPPEEMAGRWSDFQALDAKAKTVQPSPSASDQKTDVLIDTSDGVNVENEVVKRQTPSFDAQLWQNAADSLLAPLPPTPREGGDDKNEKKHVATKVEEYNWGDLDKEVSKGGPVDIAATTATTSNQQQEEEPFGVLVTDVDPPTITNSSSKDLEDTLLSDLQSTTDGTMKSTTPEQQQQPSPLLKGSTSSTAAEGSDKPLKTINFEVPGYGEAKPLSLYEVR